MSEQNNQAEIQNQQESLQNPKNAVLVAGLAGGVAGVTVDLVYYPFETLKTRIQASDKQVDYQKKSKDLNKYRGFSMQMLSSFPFAFIYFFTYEESKKILYKYNNNNNSDQKNTGNKLNNLLAASFAEGFAMSLRTPFEVVKQQQQVGHDNLVRHTISNIYKSKGIGGFYVGISTLLFRDIPFSAIQLPLYEFLKNGKQRDLSIYESVYSGAIAASIAAFLTTPMDVVKTKLMTQRDNKYKGNIDCVKQIYKEEGIMAFFKGTQYRTLPLAFTGTIFFTIYEQSKNILFKAMDKY